MENAAIIKAHDHARQAASATLDNSIASAGEAHALAAASFHEAAQDTHDAEALRILALLGDHHRRLARLVKEPPRQKGQKGQKGQSSDGAPHASDSPAAVAPPSSSATSASPAASSAQAPRVPSRRRLPHSSIASNLAEKRGIPGAPRGAPTASTVSATNAQASRNSQQSTPVRDLLQQQSTKADGASKQKDAAPANQKEGTASRSSSPPPEDNFKRFYAKFGGFIGALSAPLAFTSLPLNPSEPSSAGQEPSPSSPDETKPKSQRRPKPLEPSRTIKSSEPDIASLISKAAFQALKEDPSGPMGLFAHNESFYVVPTSGGTLSYANIMRDQQAHLHHAAQDPHLDSIAEGEDGSRISNTSLRGSSHEEFVDARESIGPPSPTTARRPRSKGSATGMGVPSAATIRAGHGNGRKTMEELQLENETLRSVLDKQAKRLSMWETTSQNSYNAISQSIRARGGLKPQMSDPSAMGMGSPSGPVAHSPPTAPQARVMKSESTTKEADAQYRKRIEDLEALVASHTSQVAALTSENQELARQNENHVQVLGRYRDRWEKLKAGARKKDDERTEKKRAGSGFAERKETEVIVESGDNAEKEGVGEREQELDIAAAEVEAGAAFGKA